MSSMQAALRCRNAEISRLKEHIRMKDGVKEGLCLAHVPVEKLTAERAFLASRAEQAQAEREALANLVCELQVDAATGDGELGIIVRGVQSLKERVVVGETRENTWEAQARETLKRMSELRLLVERLTLTVRGECP